MKRNFLQQKGTLEQEVYVKQAQGFEVKDRETHACKLKKALYGLKQDPRAWYGRIDSFLTRLGVTKSKADPNLYLKVMDDEPVILLLYVDDLFLIGNEKWIVECKKKLVEEFEMKDLGLIFPRSGSMAKLRRNLSQPRKVCSRDIEKIQYVGMQSHGHTHGFQPEVVS